MKHNPMENIVRKIVAWTVFVLINNADSYTPEAYINLQAHGTGDNKLLHVSLPDKRPLKKALGFIEDTYLNFTELTRKYDFTSEEHTVTTEDGYILRLFRILSKCNGVSKGLPVMMMHGIYDTADLWIVTGPETGLGYILSRNCYDVWAANHRGNVYSRRHVRLNPDTDPEFWEYTFDEHGNYDLPAIVDYILNTTQKTKLNYIGHSQGTADFYVMASLRPEYNAKIEISIHLAPIAFMGHIRSFGPRLLAPSNVVIRQLLYDLGLREVLGKNQIIHFVLEFLCQYMPEDFCGTTLTLTTGYKPGNISPRNLKLMFGHVLAGISSKDFAHLAQLIDTGKFRRFDEGIAGNLKKYGTVIPPDYDLSKITSAVVLICAKNDFVSELEDIDILVSKLPNVVGYYVVPDPSWSHNDHIYGTKAPKLVFPTILKHLDKVSQ